MADNTNPLELIEEYSKKLDMVTRLDVTNVFEKSLSRPNVTHEWLHKFTMQKIRLLRMVEAKEEIIQKKYGDNPMNLSKAAIKMKAETDTDLLRLNKLIRQQELLVDYLDNVVNKVLTQMGYDFKNIVALMQMENSVQS